MDFAGIKQLCKRNLENTGWVVLTGPCHPTTQDMMHWTEYHLAEGVAPTTELHPFFSIGEVFDGQHRVLAARNANLISLAADAITVPLFSFLHTLAKPLMTWSSGNNNAQGENVVAEVHLEVPS